VRTLCKATIIICCGELRLVSTADIIITVDMGACVRYTLLGVDFNAATGEIAFLILDPHYTGDDRVEKCAHLALHCLLCHLCIASTTSTRRLSVHISRFCLCSRGCYDCLVRVAICVYSVQKKKGPGCVRGACGWQRVDFFDQASFYNLCCPQRPAIY
jgi:hypothetical protein